MRLLLILLTITMATTKVNAAVKLKCERAFGEAVYSSFTLVFTKMESKYGLPYNLKGLEGTKVVLEGEANPRHPDVMPGYEDWSYVTPGKRVSTIKNDYHEAEGLGFNIETCQDCDFNGATYQYRKSSEEEIFITEDYGSDGSAEFSLYSCVEIK